MWPFRPSKKTKQLNNLIQEFEQIKADISRLSSGLALCRKDIDAFPELVQREVAQLEKQYKEFFGIEQYQKTPGKPVMFKSHGMLDHILTNIKQFHLQIKSLQHSLGKSNQNS